MAKNKIKKSKLFCLLGDIKNVVHFLYFTIFFTRKYFCTPTLCMFILCARTFCYFCFCFFAKPLCSVQRPSCNAFYDLTKVYWLINHHNTFFSIMVLLIVKKRDCSFSYVAGRNIVQQLTIFSIVRMRKCVDIHYILTWNRWECAGHWFLGDCDRWEQSGDPRDLGSGKTGRKRKKREGEWKIVQWPI